MKHISLDIECLSTLPYATIIQIGAVEFSLGDLRDPTPPPLGREFKFNIRKETSLAAGTVLDGDTVRWWSEQSDEAKASVQDERIMVGFDFAMTQFVNFFNSCKARYVWGNGSTFDNSRLAESFLLSSVDQPWHFKGDSDMRTVVQSVRRLGRVIPDVPVRDDPQFLKHDGLWDAKSQAQVIQYAYRELAKGLLT